MFRKTSQRRVKQLNRPQKALFMAVDGPNATFCVEEVQVELPRGNLYFCLSTQNYNFAKLNKSVHLRINSVTQSNRINFSFVEPSRGPLLNRTYTNMSGLISPHKAILRFTRNKRYKECITGSL